MICVGEQRDSKASIFVSIHIGIIINTCLTSIVGAIVKNRLNTKNHDMHADDYTKKCRETENRFHIIFLINGLFYLKSVLASTKLWVVQNLPLEGEFPRRKPSCENGILHFLLNRKNFLTVYIMPERSFCLILEDVAK